MQLTAAGGPLRENAMKDRITIEGRNGAFGALSPSTADRAGPGRCCSA